MSQQPLPHAPAPWDLRGSGYILFYRPTAVWGGEASFVHPDHQPHFRGGVGAVMLVDYADSPVGAYDELLFIPGFFNFQGQGRAFPAISKIYVSTQVSVVNGWQNWRIPKEEAQFARYTQGQTERVIIQTSDGERIADMSLYRQKVRLPFTTAVVPPPLRTIAQPDPRQTYHTTLAGQGWLSPAQLLHARTNQAYFPDLTQGRLLMALHVSDFRLTFPPPTF